MPLVFRVQEPRARGFAESLAPLVHRDPQNARLDLLHHERVADVPGAEIDVPGTVERLAQLGLVEGEQPTCTFHWIKSRFGQVTDASARPCSDEAFVDFLDGLIAHHSFPRPLPCPKRGGGIELGVTRKSHWIRAGVIDWFGDYLPPHAAASLDEAAARDAADDMDAAAGNLRLIGGTEA